MASGRAARVAVAWLGAAALAAGAPAEGAPLPVRIEAERLDLKEGTPAALRRCTTRGEFAMKAQWLGCISLSGAGPNGHLFGGISAAYIHQGRLLMVSDCSMLERQRPSSFGSGRLFVGDLRLGPASMGGRDLLLPAGVENATVQILEDHKGNVPAQVHGDDESLAVKWPSQIFVGVEKDQVIRRYSPKALDGPTDRVVMGRATEVGAERGSSRASAGLGKLLKGCAGNTGPEGITLVGGSALVAVCEGNVPRVARDRTVGWAADARTGEILASFTVSLPPAPAGEEPGSFYRVSAVAGLPGTEDLLVLYAYWSATAGTRVKIGRTRLPGKAKSVRGGGAASPAALAPTIIVDLAEEDGVPLDNFETLFAEKAPGADGAYVLHLVSDNNFHPERQNTLWMSLLLEEAGVAANPPPEAKYEALGRAGPPLGLVPGADRHPALTPAFLGACCSLCLGLVTLGMPRKRAVQTPASGLLLLAEAKE